jgi:hypothetical protein
MKYFKLTTIVSIITLLLSCSKEEIQPGKYTNIYTSEYIAIKLDSNLSTADSLHILLFDSLGIEINRIRFVPSSFQISEYSGLRMYGTSTYTDLLTGLPVVFTGGYFGFAEGTTDNNGKHQVTLQFKINSLFAWLSLNNVTLDLSANYDVLGASGTALFFPVEEPYIGIVRSGKLVPYY